VDHVSLGWVWERVVSQRVELDDFVDALVLGADSEGQVVAELFVLLALPLDAAVLLVEGAFLQEELSVVLLRLVRALGGGFEAE